MTAVADHEELQILGPAHVAYSNVSPNPRASPLVSELIAARPRQRREAPLHSQMVADQVHVAVVEEQEKLLPK